jgi:hypothetical protein
LEKFVYRKWISQSRDFNSFNENDGQISTLVFDRDNEDDEIMFEDVEGIGGAKDKEEDVLLFGMARKILQAVVTGKGTRLARWE